jgi:predicted DNA-binding transcriptional regulator AlpA
MNKERLLTVQETAERMNCGKSTLWRWLKEMPDFPDIVHSGIRARGFFESDVEAYLERRRQRKTA